MCDKVVCVCERLSVTKLYKLVCERVVCVCDKVVCDKVLCERVVCDKVVCDKVVFERDGLTCSVDVSKCHPCHGK